MFTDLLSRSSVIRNRVGSDDGGGQTWKQQKLELLSLRNKQKMYSGELLRVRRRKPGRRRLCGVVAPQGVVNYFRNLCVQIRPIQQLFTTYAYAMCGA